MIDPVEIHCYFDEMLSFINRKEWVLLEVEFEQIALRLAGPQFADAISAINLANYETELQEAMASAYRRAIEISAKAIYFEYDLDNYWGSHFFLCQGYNARDKLDEDWACDWVEKIDGPDFDAFADIYASTHEFDVTDEDKGATLYLVARTVAAFGRCSEEFINQPFVLCLGFHDQDPIMRVKEPIS